jgi:hypothetical protein
MPDGVLGSFGGLGHALPQRKYLRDFLHTAIALKFAH